MKKEPNYFDELIKKYQECDNKKKRKELEDEILKILNKGLNK